MDTAAVPTHVFAHAGEYSIKLTSITADGCSHDTTMLKIIKVYPMPIADFIADPAVTSIYEPVIQFQNHTVNGDTYQWTFGDSATSTLVSPNHTYAEVGAYEVVLMTSTNHNCRDTTRGIVRVEYGYSFYVPSAFTPNGDGVNDFFQGYGSFIKDYEMSIYDRWGILVYKTSEYDKPWDGKIKNREVENDVFVYRIQVTDQKDSPHTYLGKITLIR
ncbi:MAG: gliding motility-associated C-terminal domain-containing protein [Bacteroidetes bacterium]|nr:gliding motility-associated C-terminal domain-containing protein [Bacteroidota bacterium]